MANRADDGKRPDGDDGGEEKAAVSGAGGGNVTVVVLRMDMHCVGCAKKVERAIANFDGVEEVQVDSVNRKLTVIGKVDPVKIKEKLQEKTNKNVDLISAQPAKKDGGNDKKSDDHAEKKPSEEKQPDNKRHKEATVVLTIRLDCEECVQKIRKIISKFKGVHAVIVDRAKDQVAVTGTMDVGELVAYLRKKLKRSVEVVAPKKDDGGGEKGKKDGDAGDKKDKEKEGDKKGKEKEEEKAAGSAEAGKGEGSGVGGTKVEVNKMEDQGPGLQSHRPMYWDEGHVYSQQYADAVGAPQIYGHGYVVEQHPYHSQGYVVEQHRYVGEGYEMDPRLDAPQFFSDENPNACSVM